MTDEDIGRIANLNVVCDNAYELATTDHEGFCKLRRSGFGGSDSSILLGCNKWTTLQQLIDQKCAAEITDKELAVGELVNVRKGADLEPIILQKFADEFECTVYKPNSMYNIPDTCLNVNFDGIIEVEDCLIPVEAKFVSAFAGKHWNFSCARNADVAAAQYAIAMLDKVSVVSHIEHMAEIYGIPEYYYTQVQQELFAANAPYAYLAALYDRDWKLYWFKIYRDERVIDRLLVDSKIVWDLILQRRRTTIENCNS